MTAGRVFTITGGTGFLRRLARGLLRRHGDGPGSLQGMLVLLPNRRACRALGDAFLHELGGRPTLLPDISPIGEVDDGDLVGDGDPGTADLPPAISPLRRRLLLSRFVMARDPSISPGQALHLARDLARFLNEAQTERLECSGLSGLAPRELAAHWGKVLGFLDVVTATWPRALGDLGCMDPADRRNRLIEARIRSWREAPPEGPVVAAGSTGTVPAAADLLACVAGMERGAVVLPGFDRTLDAEALGRLGPTHPQHGMARLVRGPLGGAAVAEWDEPDPAVARRTAVVNLALRPPGAAAPAPGGVGAALEGVVRIECPGPDHEARAIALLLRGAVEEPGRSAALVTPDRGLARRVAAELKRWRIEIDDSGGRPLSATPAGAFLRLTADAVASDAAPVPLLAALKHPLAAGGSEPAGFRRLVRRLERAALRGPRPAPGFAGLRAAVEGAGGLGPERRAGLAGLVERVGAMAAPLAELAGRDRAPAAGLLEAHVGFAEALAATHAEDGAGRLWRHAAGEQASLLVGDLHRSLEGFPDIPGRDWPALLEAVLDLAVFRPAYGQHPRLHIWGLLEARLQDADLVVLGGLNEGTWPPTATPGPWMSRPMRREFGLAPPERQIGLTAHDFVQGLAARRVVLTRSTRVGGSPTVPARWLTRLETLLSSAEGGGRVLDRWRAEQERWLGWQAGLDRRLPHAPEPQPAPRPPVAARPSRLSVTEVETLIRDPYAVYARHVLGLRRLEPVDAEPGAAERGTVIHRAIERFLKAVDGRPHPDPLGLLVAIGREEFGPLLGRPGMRSFWWPRFERIAAWVVERERERAGRAERSHIEARGEMEVDLGGRRFTLVGRADRIDALAGGGYEVIDYKTGAVPSRRSVEGGLSPQLPLEAAMVAAGAFDGVPAGPVAALSYWHLSGGDPAGRVRPATDSPDGLARAAPERLRELLGHYEDPGSPYLARPDPGTAPKASDYGHLERVDEWLLSGGRP